jgi:hypothetical protein
MRLVVRCASFDVRGTEGDFEYCLWISRRYILVHDNVFLMNFLPKVERSLLIFFEQCIRHGE